MANAQERLDAALLEILRGDDVGWVGTFLTKVVLRTVGFDLTEEEVVAAIQRLANANLVTIEGSRVRALGLLERLAFESR